MNNNQITTIVILVAIIVVLLLVFRGCKQIDLKQKSTDTKTEISLEIQKEKIQ
jgi:hypothetical protein